MYKYFLPSIEIQSIYRVGDHQIKIGKFPAQAESDIQRPVSVFSDLDPLFFTRSITPFSYDLRGLCFICIEFGYSFLLFQNRVPDPSPFRLRIRIVLRMGKICQDFVLEFFSGQVKSVAKRS